jgi:serine/threonine protein kinase
MSLRRNWVNPRTSLGRGAYGVVYQGYHALRKEIVAIKVYFTETENHGIASTTLR